MSMLRAMRDELFKYRKRKKGSINGSMPGVPYASYRRSRRYVSGSPYVPRGPVNHELYNWGTPSEYHPDINAPAAQSEEYWPDKNWESHVVPHSTNPKLFRPFPELPVPEGRLTYEKSRAKSEFFLKVMEVMYRPFEEGQEIPSLADIWREHIHGDGPDMADLYEPISEIPTEAAEEDSTPEGLMRRFINITGALGHLQTVFPEDHPDIVNLRSALHDILDDPEAISKLESLAGELGPSKLGTGDPYANDPFEEAEQLYEQQMRLIENAFDEPIVDTPEAYMPDILEEQSEMMSEQFPEETLTDPGNLEQIVEQEDRFGATAPIFMEQEMMPHNMGIPGAMPEPTGYDAGRIADEINQAMEEVTQQPLQEEELDPLNPQFDPYMMGQFDLMQYMVDPFAMPDMYDPMEPGPMGPMPGQMPGP